MTEIHGAAFSSRATVASRFESLAMEVTRKFTHLVLKILADEVGSGQSTRIGLGQLFIGRSV